MSLKVTFDLKIRFSKKVTSMDNFKKFSEDISMAILTEAEKHGIPSEDCNMYVECFNVLHSHHSNV